MEKYCLPNLAEWMFPSQRAFTGVLRKSGETAGVFFPLKTSFLSEHRLHSQAQRRDCLRKGPLPVYGGTGVQATAIKYGWGQRSAPLPQCNAVLADPAPPEEKGGGGGEGKKKTTHR